MEETEKSNKKAKIKELENKILNNLDKYLDKLQKEKNYTNENIEIIRNNYLNHCDNLIKHFEHNYSQSNYLIEYSENLIKYNTNYELEILELRSKYNYLEKEWKKYRENNIDFHKKSKDKEKYSHMLIDKLNSFNEEKNKIIKEENDKRNNYIIETEELAKTLQEKYENYVPLMPTIFEENISLRKQIEDIIKSSVTIKDLKNNDFNKDKSSLNIETFIKNNLKDKFQSLSIQSQKYLTENSEMRTQNTLFKNKIKELENIKSSFKKEWDKLTKEIEKRKEEILFYSTENYELELRTKLLKNSVSKKNNLDRSVSELTKMKNQITSMKNINKKLKEQYEKHIGKNYEENKVDN